MSIYRMRTEMGHYFKWLLLLVLVPIFVIGGVNYFGGRGGMSPDRQVSGGGDVIATVNGSEITRGEFEQTWEQTKEQARKSGMRSALQEADMRVMIFQQLVQNRIVLDEAQQLGVDVSDTAVDQQIDKFVTMYLQENRRTVLGKLSPQREATNPKEDDEYKSELQRGGTSLDEQVGAAKAMMPREQIRARMAQMAIGQRLQTRAKPVNVRDIAASYNVYKFRQIVLATPGLPKAQLLARAAKIEQAAKGGADFAKLAADNSADPSGKRNGGSAVFSLATRAMFPPAVRDAIEKMTPGQVSPALDTPYGVYIVKVETMEAKLPAKIDPKEKQARQQQLTQERMQVVQADFEQQMRGKQRVEVSDPEFLAYWRMAGAMSSAGNPLEYSKQMKLAVAALKKANNARGNTYVQVELAQLLYRDGKSGEAVRILYPMLEGKEASIESADLRVMLGDMLLKTGVNGDKDRGIQQYQTASEVALRDPAIHQQLATKFKQLKRPDLVAKEQAWMTEFQARTAEIQAMRKKQAPGPGPGGQTKGQTPSQAPAGPTAPTKK